MFGETPTGAHAPSPPADPRRGDGTREGRSRRHSLVASGLAALALAALSLLLPSTPTYDPWAWIVWGREAADLALDTRYGPSWKPLPVLFTTPFSLFGAAAPALWLVVARAGALLGLVAAFVLGRRLGGAFAGGLAAVLLTLAGGFLRGAALGYSEGLLVAAVLVGVERHLAGRRGGALVLGFAAGLLRPEAWPFLGLYALYVFVRERRLRVLAVALMALLPLLWLGPELWGSGDALRAASRAQDPTQLSPTFAEQPWLEVLDRAGSMTPLPARVGAALAVLIAVAVLARPRGGPRTPASAEGGSLAAGIGDSGRPAAVLALAAAGAGWLGLVAVMTELGYAGNSRYLAVPIALACPIGAIGLGWAARAAAHAVGGRSAATPTAGRTAPADADRPAAILASLGVTLLCVPFLLEPLEEVAGDAREVGDEARLNSDLPEAIARAGGRDRVRACGRIYATALQVPVVAWHLRVATGRVGIEPRAPGVLFRGPPGLQPPDAPAPAPSAGGLRPVGQVGGWTVSAAC